MGISVRQPSPKRRFYLGQRQAAYLLLIPFLAFYLAFMVYPFFHGNWISWNNVDYTTTYGATFYDYITDADFDCREQLFGDGGFQSCTIYIRYYYESNYNGNDTPNDHVTCQAQIRTTPSEGWSRSRSSSASNSHYGRYDSGSLEIYFGLNSFYDPIASAKVLDNDCYIESVY